MKRMHVAEGSVDTRRAARARSPAAVLCCVLAIALTALAGCVAAKAASKTFPASGSLSTGTDKTHEEFSLRIPDGWNGEVVMLLRGAVPHHAVSATSNSDGSAASALLERGFAVVTPPARAGRVTGVRAPGERLSIHFVVGFGSPTSIYLVGMSQGEYVALATIGKTAGEFDRAMVYAPGGFVHVASSELRDTPTIEFALRADEPLAALLSYRLGIDRLDLADTLGFYYALLTGVRHEPGTARIAVGADSAR